MACNNVNPTAHAPYAAMQLIIKFSANVTKPARPELVKELSQEAGAPLVYIRPMSGGAHVFGISYPVNPAQMVALVRRLSARGDIVYVEQDQVLRHQSGN